MVAFASHFPPVDTLFPLKIHKHWLIVPFSKVTDEHLRCSVTSLQERGSAIHDPEIWHVPFAPPPELCQQHVLFERHCMSLWNDPHETAEVRSQNPLKPLEVCTHIQSTTEPFSRVTLDEHAAGRVILPHVSGTDTSGQLIMAVQSGRLPSLP